VTIAFVTSLSTLDLVARQRIEGKGSRGTDLGRPRPLGRPVPALNQRLETGQLSMRLLRLERL
jgi:hypothetical protein